MSNPKPPYNPEPAREDAFAEAARRGFAEVPGAHADRLASLRERLQLPEQELTENLPAAKSPLQVVHRAPRRWLVPAAAAAILLLVGAFFVLYDSEQQPIAAAVERDAARIQEPVEHTRKVEQDESPVAATEEIIGESSGDVAQAAPSFGEVETHPLASSQAQERRRQLAEVSRPVPPPTQSEAVPAIESEGVIPQAQSNFATDAAADEEVLDEAEPVPEISEEVETDLANNSTIQRAQLAQVTAEPQPTAAKKRSSTAPEAAKMMDDEASSSGFELERAAMPSLKNISGTVLDSDGVIMRDVKLGVEGTGASTRSDAYGEFSLQLTDSQYVLYALMPGTDTVRFDASDGTRFEVRMPNQTTLARIRREGEAAGLKLVYQRAPRYVAFDMYAQQEAPELAGQSVVVQFSVNRQGRPRQVTVGPGPQPRSLYKRARALLLDGPIWPEAYRREGWRYEVRF